MRHVMSRKISPLLDRLAPCGIQWRKAAGLHAAALQEVQLKNRAVAFPKLFIEVI